MRIHVIIIIAGLFLSAPVSRAAVPPPAEAVDLLVNAIHGVNERSGQEVMDAWAEVQRDPRPYLPFLEARVSLERIEFAQDKQRFRTLQNAILLLTRLGAHEFLVARLKQFQQKRDELTAQVRARAPKPGAVLPPSEEGSFRELVSHQGRLSQAENTVLSGFTQAGDPRLRDVLLSRLDGDQDKGLYDLYITYFQATCSQDPAVRTRLKKLLKTSDSPTTTQSLQRFFAK